MSFFLNLFKSLKSEEKKKEINYDYGKTNEEDYFQQKIPRIKEHLDKNTGKFCDINFPNNMESLIHFDNPNEDAPKLSEKGMAKKKQLFDEKKKEYQNLIEKGELKWKRISDIVNEKEEKKNVDIEVKQNNIGDCYLISFLRGMKKFQPKKYLKLIEVYHYNIGYCEVNFFTKKGGNIRVFVDDYIPYYKDTIPLFAGLKKGKKQTVGRYLLVEKAFAKLNGSYINIYGRFHYYENKYSTLCLTGIIPEVYNLEKYRNDDSSIYSILKSNIAVKNVSTSGTHNNISISGIVGNHVYTINNIEEKKNIKILQINNPHGRNNEDKMKDFKLNLKNDGVEKKIINFNIKDKNINNGELKIDLENYLKNFFTLQICEFTKVESKKKEEKGTKGGSEVPSPEDDDSENIIPLNPDIIDEINDRRKGILGSMGIGENAQNEFIDKFEDIDDGISLFFSELELKYNDQNITNTIHQNIFYNILNSQNN